MFKMWSHNAFIYSIINALTNIPNALCNHTFSLTEFFRFASFFLHLRSILREICLILDLYLPVQTSRLLLFRIFKENEDSAPSYGYCAAQQQLYWGYKFHCVCTAAGVIVRYDLSPAHHHDIKYLQDIQDEVSNCVLVGDKGYRSNPLRLTLF